MKKKNRDIEKVYSRKQFVAKLRRFADSLESNKPFRIQIGNENLYIPTNSTFNIEHEREEKNEEIEFQIKWIRK